jgi:hypothetical protein
MPAGAARPAPTPLHPLELPRLRQAGHSRVTGPVEEEPCAPSDRAVEDRRAYVVGGQVHRQQCVRVVPTEPLKRPALDLLLVQVAEASRRRDPAGEFGRADVDLEVHRVD